MIEPQPLLTTKQVALILGVHECTLANWRSTKKYSFPFVKMGKLVRYRAADVKSFIDGKSPKLRLKPQEQSVITQKGLDGQWYDEVWESGKCVSRNKSKESKE